ncbi:MAG: hypothetical protein ACYSW3_30600 [Planctomycetota bacterium]|jgi:hypothetical protein
MEPCRENCEHKARSDKRIALLADRLAVLLVVVKQRYGTDWEPWFGEDTWECEDRMADEIRGWPDYKTAKDIVKLFIRRHDIQEEGK